jgi:hypothetical protein
MPFDGKPKRKQRARPTGYTVHYGAPAYPEKCFPSRCKHPPEFALVGDVHIVPKKRGGNIIEIDHNVCLACGMPLPATIGGNVLVDLSVIFAAPEARAP